MVIGSSPLSERRDLLQLPFHPALAPAFQRGWRDSAQVPDMERDFTEKKAGTTSASDVGRRRTRGKDVGDWWLHQLCNAFAQLAHAVQNERK
jgi:hypothetical protein